MTERRLFFIVTKRKNRQVLLLKSPQGFTLPTFNESVRENVGFDNPGSFNDWFNIHYGLEVVRRYAVDLRGGASVAFIMEACREAPAPANAVWVSPDDPALALLSPASLHATVTDWLAKPDDCKTMPWSNSGGYDQALAWASDALERLGMVPSGSPQQVKNAYVSSVFRCPTARGDAYLKILPKIFIRELEVTQTLARWNITKLPQWLASDAGQGLILTADMGGFDLDTDRDADLLPIVVAKFAVFQLASIPHVDTGSPLPFYDWRLPVLVDRIPDIVEESQVLLSGSPYQLVQDEVLRLNSSLPRWRQLCDAIMSADMPSALDHGDLRPGNIRMVSGEVIFYDWAWSAITHPFIGLAGFLHIIRNQLSPATKCRLRDVYLEPWQDYAPLEHLRSLFDQVDEVRALYGTVADAEWLRCIWEALSWQKPPAMSADAWTLDRRQYYFAKMLRRLICQRSASVQRAGS